MNHSAKDVATDVVRPEQMTVRRGGKERLANVEGVNGTGRDHVCEDRGQNDDAQEQPCRERGAVSQKSPTGAPPLTLRRGSSARRATELRNECQRLL
jgi:hypothetical protein